MTKANNENITKEMVRQYLIVHDVVMKELKRSTGKTPEPYKDLEINVLEQFFGVMIQENGDGLNFISKMLSGLIINQALPNTNHRTSLYFIANLLKQYGLNIDAVKNEKSTHEFFHDSKHIMHKGKRDYKEKHLEMSKQFIIKVLGVDQSGKLGSMEAKSFIVSFNASSNDNIGF